MQHGVQQHTHADGLAADDVVDFTGEASVGYPVIQYTGIINVDIGSVEINARSTWLRPVAKASIKADELPGQSAGFMFENVNIITCKYIRSWEDIFPGPFTGKNDIAIKGTFCASCDFQCHCGCIPGKVLKIR